MEMRIIERKNTMKIYVDVRHEIEVDDKYKPLISSWDTEFFRLFRELSEEVKQKMNMNYFDEAEAEEKAYIMAVYNEDNEPIIEC